MKTTLTPSLTVSFLIATVATLLVGCSDTAPLAPARQPLREPLFATSARAQDENVLATLRRVTARYHDLDSAIADQFVFLHGCEVRPGEGPVGIVYVNIARLMDGAIDPALPDALIYEPSKRGKPKLTGVELAVPYPLWTGAEPPSFLGATFQREDEFGVFGLHVWLWRNNPEGLFAESNPKISCDAE